jgi:hypothetical protein
LAVRVTITAEARATLTAALAAELAPWPVFATRPPGELPTPCVFVDVAGRRADVDDGAPLVVVTFPIVAVVDGADDAQTAALDDVGDVVWDVARALHAEPVYASADSVDVGGPRLRTLTTTVDVVVEHVTLCPSHLSEAAS